MPATVGRPSPATAKVKRPAPADRPEGARVHGPQRAIERGTQASSALSPSYGQEPGLAQHAQPGQRQPPAVGQLAHRPPLLGGRARRQGRAARGSPSGVGCGGARPSARERVLAALDPPGGDYNAAGDIARILVPRESSDSRRRRRHAASARRRSSRPKPMIEIGGKPILWHIMKIYSAHGINDFVVCLGYHGYMIKEYFANYFLHTSDVTFDIATNEMEVHQSSAEPWRVTLVDTGEETQTGGRLKRVLHYVGDEEFCFTYGDGVVRRRHRRADRRSTATQGTLATVTAVQPPGRFGALEIDGDRVRGFEEKPHGDGGWINGGFFVLSPERRSTTSTATTTVWEREPMERLAARGPARAVPARRLLAPDGHAARQELPRGAVGLGRGAVEDVGVNPGFWRGRACSSPATPASREAGSRCGCTRSAPRSTATRSRRRPTRRLFELARVGEAVDVASTATCATWRALERAVARAPARGRVPPGRAVARAPLLRRPGRDLRDQRDGHGATCSRRCGARRRVARRRQRHHATRCYENRERDAALPRGRAKGGHDPYSNSKACAELVTAAYRDSFFAAGTPTAVASARAGNVIGGGDWGEDRLVPDLMRGALARPSRSPIRNPDAIRPWQHVLNPLSGYLMLAERDVGVARLRRGMELRPRRARRAAGAPRSPSACRSCGTAGSVGAGRAASTRTRRTTCGSTPPRRASGSAGRRAGTSTRRSRASPAWYRRLARRRRPARRWC